MKAKVKIVAVIVLLLILSLCLFACNREGNNQGDDPCATSHTLQHVLAVDATCVAAGNIEYWQCSVCGKYFSDESATAEIAQADTVLVAKGHTEVIDEAVAPTCTAECKTEGKHCSVCNAVIVAQEVVPATGHSWDEGKLTTEPTCTTDGEKTYTCSVCGETKTETAGKLGHNYVDGVCERCGAEKISEGLEYSLNADGNSYYVSGIGSCADTEIVVADKHEGKPVTGIGANAFKDCSGLTSIVVPGSITTIGESAFV